MSLSEAEYIELCKKQLEEKFSFGNGNSHSQKDLELLSNYIEDEKGVSISLSTLKRLWKNEFKQGPQLATLNALVGVLDYENWQHFKLQNKITNQAVQSSPMAKIKPKYKWNIVLWSIIPLLAILIFAYLQKNERPKSGIAINGPVSFDVDKTLFSGVPNTAIFSYDLSNVVADSFFIQQSWNRWRREKIDPSKSKFSSIYYESGFHRAKLIANDSIIANRNVHVLSDGWESHLYYDETDRRFIDFNDENFIENGILHIPVELLSAKQVDRTRDFYTTIRNSKAYGISSNYFQLKTKVKVDQVSESNCPWLIVQVVTEKHIFYVKLVRKGCEMNAAYKLGEIVKKGKDNDLSRLGQSVYDWQEIIINVQDRHAEISINGILAYSEIFHEDFGEIMSLSYLFDGTGSIDYVVLSDPNGETVFEDDFNE